MDQSCAQVSCNLPRGRKRVAAIAVTDTDAAPRRLVCRVFQPASPVLCSVQHRRPRARRPFAFKAFLAVFGSFAVSAPSPATAVITTANSVPYLAARPNFNLRVVHRFLIQVVRSLIVAFDRVLRPGLD